MLHVVVIVNSIMLPYLRLFVVFIELACVVCYYIGLVHVVVYFSIVVLSCMVFIKVFSSMFSCGKTFSLLSLSFSIVCCESLSKSEIVKGHSC